MSSASTVMTVNLRLIISPVKSRSPRFDSRIGQFIITILTEVFSDGEVSCAPTD